MRIATRRACLPSSTSPSIGWALDEQGCKITRIARPSCIRPVRSRLISNYWPVKSPNLYSSCASSRYSTSRNIWSPCSRMGTTWRTAGSQKLIPDTDASKRSEKYSNATFWSYTSTVAGHFAVSYTSLIKSSQTFWPRRCASKPPSETIIRSGRTSWIMWCKCTTRRWPICCR